MQSITFEERSSNARHVSPAYTISIGSHMYGQQQERNKKKRHAFWVCSLLNAMVWWMGWLKQCLRRWLMGWKKRITWLMDWMMDGMVDEMVDGEMQSLFILSKWRNCLIFSLGPLWLEKNIWPNLLLPWNPIGIYITLQFRSILLQFALRVCVTPKPRWERVTWRGRNVCLPMPKAALLRIWAWKGTSPRWISVKLDASLCYLACVLWKHRQYPVNIWVILGEWCC